MVSILGYLVPENKQVRIALKQIYGLGNFRSNQIIEILGFDQNLKVKDISEIEISKLLDFVLKEKLVGSELERELKNNLLKLLENNCYRGFRHRQKLPVRGQKTKNNAKTQRKLANNRLKK
jgi:small subunit ribosomal protein S13